MYIAGPSFFFNFYNNTGIWDSQILSNYWFPLRIFSESIIIMRRLILVHKYTPSRQVGNPSGGEILFGKSLLRRFFWWTFQPGVLIKKECITWWSVFCCWYLVHNTNTISWLRFMLKLFWCEVEQVCAGNVTFESIFGLCEICSVISSGAGRSDLT